MKKKIITTLVLLTMCMSFISCSKSKDVNTADEKDVEVVDEILNVNENEMEYQTKANETYDTVERIDSNPLNKTSKDKAIAEMEEYQHHAFTELDYVSLEKVVFHGDRGLIVYDLKNEKITGAVNLQELDMNHIQGDNITVFEMKNDENEILMFNSVFYSNEEDRVKHVIDDQSVYIYNNAQDTIRKTNIKTFGKEKIEKQNFGEIKTYDNKYLNRHSDLHCLSYSNVDEHNVCFLLSPANESMCRHKEISTLKLLFVNTETDEEKMYEVKIN